MDAAESSEARAEPDGAVESEDRPARTWPEPEAKPAVEPEPEPEPEPEAASENGDGEWTYTPMSQWGDSN